MQQQDLSRCDLARASAAVVVSDASSDAAALGGEQRSPADMRALLDAMSLRGRVPALPCFVQAKRPPARPPARAPWTPPTSQLAGAPPLS